MRCLKTSNWQSYWRCLGAYALFFISWMAPSCTTAHPCGRIALWRSLQKLSWAPGVALAMVQTNYFSNCQGISNLMGQLSKLRWSPKAGVGHISRLSAIKLRTSTVWQFTSMRQVDTHTALKLPPIRYGQSDMVRWRDPCWLGFRDESWEILIARDPQFHHLFSCVCVVLE